MSTGIRNGEAASWRSDDGSGRSVRPETRAETRRGTIRRAGAAARGAHGDHATNTPGGGLQERLLNSGGDNFFGGGGDAHPLLDSHGAGSSELRGGVGIGSRVEWLSAGSNARVLSHTARRMAQPEQGIQQFNTTFLLTSFSFGFGRGAVLIGPESAEFAFFATEHFLQQSKKGLSHHSRGRTTLS